MAIDFPASPTLNQTFSSGNVNYVWDGTKWTASVTGGISLDKIEKGNTKAEVVDTGTDGRFVVTTEGTERLRVDSNGDVTINDKIIHSGDTNTAIRFPAADIVSVETNGSERARIDSSGRLLVGTSSSRGAGGIIQAESVGNDKPYVEIISDFTNSNAVGGGFFLLSRAGSSAIGSTTTVSSGNELGTIRFRGHDGTGFIPAADIKAEIDGTPGTNDMPGRLVFSTTADGASSPTERMRISSNGETTFSATVNTILGLKIGEASGWSGNPAIHTSSNVGYIIIRNGTSGGVGLSGGGTSWSSLSDENYKTDLTPIIDAATKVRSLRTVTGRYIEDDEATSRSFLIAQDVEAVLPEAVSTADSGQKLLSYTDTIPLLAAALKEALEKIETLEAKVATLESA